MTTALTKYAASKRLKERMQIFLIIRRSLCHDEAKTNRCFVLSRNEIQDDGDATTWFRRLEGV